MNRERCGRYHLGLRRSTTSTTEERYLHRDLKPVISRIRNRSAKHYEVTFDVSTYQKYKICVNGSLTKPLIAVGAKPSSNLGKFPNYTDVYCHDFSLLSFDVYNTKS